jgi:hypothetical protein
VVVGAMFGLVAAGPWLATAVGVPPPDLGTRTDEVVAILVGIVASAALPPGSRPALAPADPDQAVGR